MSLIPSLGVHRVWTHCADLSDHFPICLEWDKNKGSCIYPFKFNRSWLNDPDFTDWFKGRWSLPSHCESSVGIDMITSKLHTLKIEAKAWIKNKSDSMDSVTISLDREIESLLLGPSNGNPSMEELARLA